MDITKCWSIHVCPGPLLLIIGCQSLQTSYYSIIYHVECIKYKGNHNKIIFFVVIFLLIKIKTLFGYRIFYEFQHTLQNL